MGLWNVQRGKPVIAINDDGKNLLFSTILECAEYFGVPTHSISTLIYRGNKRFGCYFDFLYDLDHDDLEK